MTDQTPRTGSGAAPLRSVGRAATANGGKYIRQLCKHWSHKFAVEETENGGVVHLPAATARMTAGDDQLVVTLETEDPAALERMKAVVAEHLDRFAFREAPLPFTWSAE